jgi:eukaryotic-like serine/threonine-protein kinase
MHRVARTARDFPRNGMSNVVDCPKLGSFEYRVVRTLGTGAGSTILLIEDAKTGRRLALKVVKRHEPEDDVYITQAVHEFDVAQRLNHPSLLKIHDIRVKKGWFKTSGVELLMEYVLGENLDQLGTRDIPTLVLIFLHVASALKHMHRRGIYHGDLKPSNIMLANNGTVRVLDFGTCWIRGQPKDRVQGTPQYMAPEQAIERTVGEKTDVYNFGATMYRLLTGEYANLGIPGVGDGAIGSRMRPKRPHDLDNDVPFALDGVVMACLETSPERRPESFHEIKRELVAVAKQLGLDEDDSS